MNEVESDALLRVLSDLRRRDGLGLLIVEHDLSLILRLCDRIIVLNKGEIIAEGAAGCHSGQSGRNRGLHRNQEIQKDRISRRHIAEGVKEMRNRWKRFSRRFVLQSFCSAMASAGVLAIGAAAASEDTLDIGFAAALSGYLAPFDQPVLNGVRLAVEEINAAGGIDGRYLVNLEVKDIRSETAQSAIAAQEFVNDEIDVLFVPCDNDPGIAAGSVAQANELVSLSPCNSSSSGCDRGRRLYVHGQCDG